MSDCAERLVDDLQDDLNDMRCRVEFLEGLLVGQTMDFRGHPVKLVDFSDSNHKYAEVERQKDDIIIVRFSDLKLWEPNK